MLKTTVELWAVLCAIGGQWFEVRAEKVETLQSAVAVLAMRVCHVVRGAPARRPA